MIRHHVIRLPEPRPTAIEPERIDEALPIVFGIGRPELRRIVGHGLSIAVAGVIKNGAVAPTQCSTPLRLNFSSPHRVPAATSCTTNPSTGFLSRPTSRY